MTAKVCRSIKTNNSIQQMLHSIARSNPTKAHLAPNMTSTLSYILYYFEKCFTPFIETLKSFVQTPFDT